MTTSTGQYTVQPEGALSAVGNVGGIAVSAMNVVKDLQGLVLPATSFGTIGASVAGQNTAMQAHQVSSMQLLLKLMQAVGSLVQQCVTNYNSADQQVATSYGAPPTTTNGLWSSTAATSLASFAGSDNTGAAGQPGNVGNVVNYLHEAGLGTNANATFANPDGFANWLDASPTNAAQAGVIGVYSGSVHSLSDVPGGVQSGDIVVADSGGAQSIGVVGADGTLLNHGVLASPIDASVRVYRATPAVPSGVTS